MICSGKRAILFSMTKVCVKHPKLLEVTLFFVVVFVFFVCLFSVGLASAL